MGRLANIQKWQIAEMRKRGADVRVLKGLDAVQDFLVQMKGDGKT